MGKKKWPSAYLNNITYQFYYNWFKLLYINSFVWDNLPEECDARFLELMEFEKGLCLFYKDEITDKFCTLPCNISGKWNIYNIPVQRRAFATNGYNYKCTENDSVIIWNNYLHQPMANQCSLYAMKLYEIERAIDVNVKSQKYPVLLKSSEKQRLVMQNLYMQYDGNTPFIFGDEDLNIEGISAINTGAPYVAADLFQLKTNYINEWLSICGIENSSKLKKERLLADEIKSDTGLVEAMRNSALDARKQAVEKINKMFDLNIEVRFNSNLPTPINRYGEINTEGENSTYEQIYNGNQVDSRTSQLPG